MLYNKTLFIALSLFLSVGLVVGQRQIGFGDSVLRDNTLNTSVSPVTYPSTMAMRAFRMHVSYHNISLFGEEGILSLTREVQATIITDIISLLDQATDKNMTIATYLSTMQGLLDRSVKQLDTTRLRLDVFTQGMQACLRDKDAADRLFFTAINDNDDRSAQESLELSLRASSCATTYRVQANALKAQYDKLTFYVSILDKKYTYIDDKKNIIVKHYPVLRADLLKELTLISSELQSFVLVR